MQRTSNIDDCLVHYVQMCDTCKHYGFTADDVRGGLVEVFSMALFKNNVKPNDPLVLVFACSGSAITEREMVKKAVEHHRVVHVVLCDTVYAEAHGRPDASSFGVPSTHVHFVDDIFKLPAYMSEHFADKTHKVMYNSVFHTMAYGSPSKNVTNMPSLARYFMACNALGRDVSAYMRDLSMPYGIHFDVDMFMHREYIVHYPTNKTHGPMSLHMVTLSLARLEQLKRACIAV
jgi:hypothetical protein